MRIMRLFIFFDEWRDRNEATFVIWVRKPKNTYYTQTASLLYWVYVTQLVRRNCSICRDLPTMYEYIHLRFVLVNHYNNCKRPAVYIIIAN